LFLLPRSGFELGQCALCHSLAIDQQNPLAAQVAQVGEPAAVLNRETPLAGVLHADADRLRKVLVFEQAGMRFAIRPDETVAHEVLVARLIAKVAAIGPKLTTVVSLLLQTVVHPLPDEAALQAVVFFK